MMYPMISGLDEVNEANALVEACKAELRAKGQPFDEQMEIGAMIEIPSAALVAGALAKRLKFFSIGTNDLIQYGLAIDRANKQVAHMYQALDPAIIRMIHQTARAARANRIPVHMCGEMAGRPLHTPLLLGMGLNDLSMHPQAVPLVKRMIRSISLADAREMAKKVMTLKTARDAFLLLREVYGDLIATTRAQLGN
jgi:phosphotransferase system enzyme I (PtsI)